MAEATEKKEGKVLKERRPTAQKRDLQNAKRRGINRTFKSSVRTAVRNFEEAVISGDQAAINERLSTVYSLMDRGVKRGIYKLNKASRTKARFTVRATASA